MSLIVVFLAACDRHGTASDHVAARRTDSGHEVLPMHWEVPIALESIAKRSQDPLLSEPIAFRQTTGPMGKGGSASIVASRDDPGPWRYLIVPMSNRLLRLEWIEDKRRFRDLETASQFLKNDDECTALYSGPCDQFEQDDQLRIRVLSPEEVSRIQMLLSSPLKNERPR